MSVDMGIGNPNVSSLDKAAKVEKFNMNTRSQVQYRFTFLTLSYLTYSIVIGRPLSIADPDLLLPNETGAPDRDFGSDQQLKKRLCVFWRDGR